MAWPPTLADLKDDLDIDAEETEDDDALTRRLAAAIGFVQRTRKDAFLTDDDGNLVQPVELTATIEEDSLVLGTIMLAGWLFAARRSPDGILFMAETGTTRVPTTADPHISRMLRIGRHRKPVVG